MQENLRGWYKELLIPLPKPRPNPEEDKDLNKPFIPPIPAFLNVISALMILREMMTSKETTNDIGNGKTMNKMTTIPREVSNQTR
jgi:hypothetical protein